MATDREAARRQRLRGAQTRDVVDADMSFGFRLPGQPSTMEVSESIPTEGQIATPTPEATREGRPDIGGTKRDSPAGDMDNIPDIIRAQDGSTRPIETNEQAAKRRRVEPSINEDSISRVAGRNARLRGADLRSPGVGVQDFGFIVPHAPANLVAEDMPTTGTNPQTGDIESAPPGVGDETRTLRPVTPEFQVLAETTNISMVRSSGADLGPRSIRSSSRRSRRDKSTQERSVEVSGSPPDRPGSGRRVRVSMERTENPDAAEAAARRLNDVMSTPMRAEREISGREASPTLTVERPRERAVERRDENEDVDMDELSPDRSKAVSTSSPRRKNIDEDVSLESIRESIEGGDGDAEEEREASPISDEAAAAALRRNRAPKGTYIEPRRDGKDLDEEEDASDQYEESADEEAGLDNLSVAQQRKRLAKMVRKRKNGDIGSPAIQKPAKNKTAARIALNADGSEPRKRGRPKGSKNNSKTARSNARAQNMGPRSKEMIAVQTYRLNEFAPPAELAGEGEAEDEILTQPIPFPNLPRNTGGVNSIDVLSQMLNEVLQSALESLEQGAARADEAAQRKQTAEKVAERREYRTKLRAVEAWGEAAGGALLEMGLGLDAAMAMNRRVKELERERLELRERLGEIRRERERVGVRGDGVRSRHEREGAKRMADRELQSVIEGVSVVVGVCRERDANDQDEEEAKGDIITRLKETASMVSSKKDQEGGNGNGLLNRLKRMNSLLERAAGALEGR